MKFGQYRFEEFELDTERFELRRATGHHQAGHRDEADRIAGRIRDYHPGIDRAGVLSALPIFSEPFLKHFNEVFREYRFD
jgi:hypothetical protein